MNDDVLQLVHAQLNAMTLPEMSLHRNSSRATFNPNRPFDVSDERLRFQRSLLDELLSEGEGDIEKEGRAAVLVTAGPPGAGKSTKIAALGLADGWREIDADLIKVKLLEAAVRDGIYDDFLATNLADGYPIMMNELSSLVHNESVILADRMIERCLERQENVVIQGTLTWDELVPRYSRMFALYDYSAVTLLDVEVEKSVALAQAFNRWSTGRIKAIEGGAEGGGRFTPTEAITAIYDSSGRYSHCNENAVDFFNTPGAEDFDDLKLIVCDGEGPENQTEYQRIVGTYTTSIPKYLKDRDMTDVAESTS